MICVDVNGGGGPDVIVANGGASFLSEFINCAEFSVLGDLDGDSTVGITDFLMLLAVWGPCPEPCPPSCPADLDDDCIVGITDFLLLLAN